MTRLNQQILELLRNSSGHLNAEEVFLLAKEKGIKVSLASVYRILSKLADDGYINRIIGLSQQVIFDKTPTDHIHAICNCCGKVVDVDLDIKDYLSSHTKLKIDSYNLHINYVCDDCIQ